MANALEIQIADAVVAEINDAARSWAGQFQSRRTWHPVYTEGQLATLWVDVVVIDLTEERISRATGTGDVKVRQDYGPSIDFQQSVDRTNDAAMDALTNMVASVHDFFIIPHRLATLNAALVFEAKRPMIYDIARLYAEGVWETVIDLTVRVLR